MAEQQTPLTETTGGRLSASLNHLTVLAYPTAKAANARAVKVGGGVFAADDGTPAPSSPRHTPSRHCTRHSLCQGRPSASKPGHRWPVTTVAAYSPDLAPVFGEALGARNCAGGPP